MLIPKIKTADHLASIKTYSGVKPLETIAKELNIPLEQNLMVTKILSIHFQKFWEH